MLSISFERVQYPKHSILFVIVHLYINQINFLNFQLTYHHKSFCDKMLYLVYLVVFCMISNSLHISAEQTPLYTSLDMVNILTDSNFTDFVVNEHQDGRKLLLIHFYADWCPHCTNYSVIFKQFLEVAHKWDRYIDFAVFPCSTWDNRNDWDSICDQYKVPMVPRFRLFWFAPKSTDIGIDVIRKYY